MLDFEQTALDSLVQPAVLVTIVCEAVLKDSIIGLLKNLKVMGYTVSDVQGEQRHSRRVEPSSTSTVESNVEITVESSVEIKAIVTKEISNVILYALKEQQQYFAILAYRQTVEALVEE
jgi:hypothetical protein